MLPMCVEGQYTKERVPVTTDVFSICSALKREDDRYFVMFNRETQKFEVHVRGQRGTTLGCELPFPELDYRTIQYVRKYSAARTDETARDVEQHNERLDQTRMKLFQDEADYKMANAIRYVDSHPSKDGEAIPKELINE